MTTPESSSFASFGRSFQEKVLQAIIVDRNWATQFIEVFDVDECLDQTYLQLIANKYIGHYRKWKEFPSTDLLMTILRDGLSNDKDVVLREQCVAFMRKVLSNTDLGDLPWVKDKAFAFCRQQMLKKALLECVDLIQTDKQERVVEVMKEALNAGNTFSPGYDYNVDIDARYSTTYRNTVPTGIQQLDDRKVLNGGLGAGEIGIVVSPTGVGKCLDFSKTLVSVQYEEIVIDGQIFLPWKGVMTRRGFIPAYLVREDDELVGM